MLTECDGKCLFNSLFDIYRWVWYTEIEQREQLTMTQAKVFIVDQPYKAKYKVYFLDQPYQEKNAAIIAGGKLVKNEWEADVKVCILQQEDQAVVKNTCENFPS